MTPSYFNYSSVTLTGLVALAAVAGPVPASAAVTNLGTAYRLNDGVIAYRESHLLFESGGIPSRLVLYRCADGSAFARKIVRERTGALTPDFDFIDGRSGHREGVRTTSNGREVYWQKSAAAAEKKKLLDMPSSAVIDAGFDAKVQSEWARLAADQVVSTNFLLPSAMRFFKVGIERGTSKAASGRTHLRMKLDTWYGFAAPETQLDYRTSDRRLLRFKGLGSVRDMAGRNQSVRIEFPGGLQGMQASPGEIEAARTLPLTGRCGV